MKRSEMIKLIRKLLVKGALDYEVLDAIEKELLYDKIGETVKSVLTESDLVKFAKFIPEKTVGENLFESTVTLVEITKVVPVDNNSGNVSTTVPVKEVEV